VGVGVREGSQTIIVFLSGCIPQCQLNVLSINLDICYIVLKDSRNIDLRITENLALKIADKRVRTSGKVPFENTINKQV
jgi:hypothetical protein